LVDWFFIIIFVETIKINIMHISEIQNVITPEKAIEKLKLNDSNIFKWFLIKGKNGCIYKMGGRNTRLHGLELTINVPHYEKGLPKLYPNKFLTSNFNIGFANCIHQNDGFNVNYNDFIEYSKSDLRKLLVFEETEESIKYNTIKKYKFID